jgi:hypothetical protein
MLLFHPKHISVAPSDKKADQPVQAATCTILSVLYASTFLVVYSLLLFCYCLLFVYIQETLQNLHKNKNESLRKTVELLICNNVGLAVNR